MTSIALCVSTYSLAKWRQKCNKTIQQTIDFIAQTGVTHIEFSGVADHTTPNLVKQATLFQRRCDNRNLTVASYCTPSEL